MKKYLVYMNMHLLNKDNVSLNKVINFYCMLSRDLIVM